MLEDIICLRRAAFDMPRRYERLCLAPWRFFFSPRLLTCRFIMLLPFIDVSSYAIWEGFCC